MPVVPPLSFLVRQHIPLMSREASALMLLLVQIWNSQPRACLSPNPGETVFPLPCPPSSFPAIFSSLPWLYEDFVHIRCPCIHSNNFRIPTDLADKPCCKPVPAVILRGHTLGYDNPEKCVGQPSRNDKSTDSSSETKSPCRPTVSPNLSGPLHAEQSEVSKD